MASSSSSESFTFILRLIIHESLVKAIVFKKILILEYNRLVPEKITVLVPEDVAGSFTRARESVGVEERVFFPIKGFVDGQEVGSVDSYIIIQKSLDGVEVFATLNNVHVEEEFRRRGLGGKMVRELEATARELGCSYIWGYISVNDLHYKPWLREFYEKLGFEIDENRKIVKALW